MNRPYLFGALAACVAMTALANERAMAPELAVDRIIEKNVAARGGLEAWRNIGSMVWAGHIESAKASASNMHFELVMKRPNKTRFQIASKTQVGLRVYDGAQGWKMHPAANGKPELQPYTSEELSFANDQGFDGPLIDCAAKGIAVRLEGVDEVEGRKAYRLNLRPASGASQTLWIDAESFLEMKLVRQSRNAMGQAGTSSVFYRNYQAVEGVQLPFTIESGADTARTPDRMVIEKIKLNPALDDGTFDKPKLAGQRHGVTVDTRSPAPAGRPMPGPTPAASRISPPLQSAPVAGVAP